MSDTYWDIHAGGVVLRTKITRGNRATIVNMGFSHGEHNINIDVTGEALLHPGDKRNPEIGDQLALARAYEALGRRLRKRAEGLVKHYDDIAKDEDE